MKQDVPENQNSYFDDPQDDEWNPSFAWSDAQAMAYLAARWDQAGARAPRVVGRIRRMEGGFGFLTDLHQPENGRLLLAPAENTRVHEGVFIPPQELQRLPPKPDDVEYAIAALELSPLARRQDRDDPLACSVRVGTLELLRRVPAEWGVYRMEGDSAPMLTDLARQVIEAKLQDDTSAARDALDSVQAQLAEARTTKTSLAAELALARQQLQESSTRIDEIEADAANRRAELEKRLTELTALLKEKGERMVALRLVEPEDLAHLFPAKAADDARPGHDFGKDLGEDWGRLASYVQTYLWQKGMHYTAAQLQDYLALLRTNDLIVLAGDSGSGKTSLVKSVAEALGGKCAVVPVKPNWTSSEDLMGYYNPIEQRFHPTQFLLALLDAAAEPDVPHFICLDEMNLARVEYYFADFLSLLESRDSLPWIHLYGTQEEQQTALDNRLFLKLEEEARNRSGLGPNATLEELLLNDQANQELRKLAGFQEADTVLSHHARLRRAVSALIRLPSGFCFPPNVWILGAINVDETTHYLSPKILDRVHVMRFTNPVLVDWESEESTLASFDLDMAIPVRMRAVEIGRRGLYPPFDRSQPDIAWLAELSKEFLDLLGIEFGLRAIRQSVHYLDKAQGCGINEAEALNNVLMHKVLPKLVVDVDKLAPTGEKRRDLLKRMAQFIGAKLQTMDEAPPDNASVRLQQMLVRAEANHGIANFWGAVMLPPFELRYLAIDWDHPQSVHKLEVAATPLSIERVDDEYLTETTIFKDRYAWVGIRLQGKSIAAPPALVTNAGLRPLLAITDPAGKDEWWILSDGWDSAKKRYLSELRRSAGDFVFYINGERLRVRNLLSETGNADIQAYVDDFTGSLLWMIVNDAAGATARARGGAGGEGLLAALEALQEAASRVFASPAVAIRETVDEVPLGRLRPTAATFRRYVVAPGARTLPGRVFHESLDTPENRFLRHMLALCVSWSTAWKAGTSTGTRFLQEMAEREEERAHINRTVTHRRVEPEMFDAQTGSMAVRLDALRDWHEDDAAVEGRRFHTKITLGAPYKTDGFFYQQADAGWEASQDGIAYRVIHFPDQVRTLISPVLHVCKTFTFECVATSSIKTNVKGKSFREVRLTSLIRIEAHTAVLEERAERRERLVANGWMTPISRTERRELEREALVATQRAATARRKMQSIHEMSDGIERIAPKLQALEDALASKGVRRDAFFPMGMLYVTNPNYAACLRSFKEVETLLRANGLNPDVLEGLQRVGILHASDIYEKWCLLKVCMTLQDDFRFEGTSGWIDRLVKTTVGGERNVRFSFERRDVGTKLIVAYQHETKLGTRPDILVWVRTRAIDPSEDPLASALILDAKYRTSWPPQGPAGELESLVAQKQYGDSPPGAGVFILQPCGSTVWPPASPLDWGRHCDYGAHLKSHRQGWIQMRAGNAQHDSMENLKRLLGMALQNALPPPEQDVYTKQWHGPSFCVHCGSVHEKHSVEGRATKKGVSWTFRCTVCEGWTLRTHCYQCAHTLFKNGTQWTYHETLADQVTNVLCPACGAYFDTSFRAL